MDLNADIGKIISDLLSGKKRNDKNADGSNVSKKGFFENEVVKISILKSILAICVTIILCFVVNKVTSNPIKKVSAEFKDSESIKLELEKLATNIKQSQSLLELNRNKITKILPRFSDTHGGKTIFKQITVLASEDNLIIKNINIVNRKDLDKPVNHSEIQMLLELEGYYANYINFKKKLAEQKPFIRIDKENLLLDFNSNEDRKIAISVELTDFAIERQDYEKILGTN
jgi:hypothetical protein